MDTFSAAPGFPATLDPLAGVTASQAPPELGVAIAAQFMVPDAAPLLTVMDWLVVVEVKLSETAETLSTGATASTRRTRFPSTRYRFPAASVAKLPTRPIEASLASSPSPPV